MGATRGVGRVVGRTALVVAETAGRLLGMATTNPAVVEVVEGT